MSTVVRVEDMIGTPFLVGGRQPGMEGGLDCLGTWLLGLSSEGITVPDPWLELGTKERWESRRERIVREGDVPSEWDPIKLLDPWWRGLRFLDTIITTGIHFGETEEHVALIWKQHQVLHAVRDVGTVLTPYAKIRHVSRAYRFRSLAP